MPQPNKACYGTGAIAYNSRRNSCIEKRGGKSILNHFSSHAKVRCFTFKYESVNVSENFAGKNILGRKEDP